MLNKNDNNIAKNAYLPKNHTAALAFFKQTPVILRKLIKDFFNSSAIG